MKPLKKSLPLFFIYIFLFSYCSDDSVIDSPVVDEPDPILGEQSPIQDFVFEVSSVQPANEDYSDLQPFKEVIGNSRVVLLGEQSHGDGSTFLAKTRLIKFLHKEMGFDVLLFESGLFDCRKINDFLDGGEPYSTAISKGVFGIWTRSNQCKELISYIGENRNTLTIGGFDSQFTGSASREHFVNDLEEYLASEGLDLINVEFWSQTREILQNISDNKYYSTEPPSESDRNSYFQTLDNTINFLKNSSGNSNSSNKNFWMQMLKSVQKHSDQVWKRHPYGNDFFSIPKSIRNMRDIQMGENLIWHAKENYKDRKIIVWAATFHNVRNIDKIQILNDPDFYQGTVTMGHVAWQELQEQMYILGFTAYEGEVTSISNGNTWTLEKPQDGSLEDMFFKTGYENAILDFRSLPNDIEWMNDETVSRPLGYGEMKVDWREVMDGMMFTKTMIPSVLN